MATASGIHQILETMWAAYNRNPPEADRLKTKQLWLAAMESLTDAHLSEAVEHWCRTEERLPTFSQILDLGQARRRAAAGAARELAAPLPTPEYPIKDRRAVGALLRSLHSSAATAALVTVETPQPDGSVLSVTLKPDKHTGIHHGHGKSASGCPACTRHTFDENGHHVRAEACARCIRLAHDRYQECILAFDEDFEPGFEPETGEGEPKDLPSYRCLHCRDLKWVTDPSMDAVWPCSRCNTEAFHRWQHGHYAPGHDCPECTDVRRGTAPKADQRKDQR